MLRPDDSATRIFAQRLAPPTPTPSPTPSLQNPYPIYFLKKPDWDKSKPEQVSASAGLFLKPNGEILVLLEAMFKQQGLNMAGKWSGGRIFTDVFLINDGRFEMPPTEYPGNNGIYCLETLFTEKSGLLAVGWRLFRFDYVRETFRSTNDDFSFGVFSMKVPKKIDTKLEDQNALETRRRKLSEGGLPKEPFAMDAVVKKEMDEALHCLLWHWLQDHQALR